ncbi:MAG: hypothetical protein FD126_3505 [Elusimicrobia bacterium]|nr:MAG: hypothetical protein FD126_3505 [Elusimicrobiota bacterium]
MPLSKTVAAALALAVLPAWAAAQVPWRTPARLQPLPSPLVSGFPEAFGGAPVIDRDPRPDVSSRCCEPRPWDYMACRDCDRDLIDGFYFANHGVNRIVTRPFDPYEMSPQRWFQVDYHSHARQEIYLWIADMPTGRVPDFLESFFMAFPRKVLPSIRAADGKFTLTLANEETVVFDEASKEIIGGVFTEDGPQELGVFARLTYSGTGLILRADKRGGDPRLGTQTVIRSGSASCTLPSSALWAMVDDHVDFRFPTDEPFDALLRARCGFGIPGL